MRTSLKSHPVRLAVAFAAFSLLPLALLTGVSIHTGSSAVRSKERESLSLSARLSALYIGSELSGLAEVDQSVARRPTLVRYLEQRRLDRAARAYIRLSLRQLLSARRGIETAFLADARGKLIDIVPETPSIVGKDFSFRDWYKGVVRTGRAYVSEAYESQAVGHPKVVAVTAPVMTAGPHPRRLGIVVAAYGTGTIQSFAQQIGRAEGVTVEVTDQRGVGLAVDPLSREAPLTSHRSDPLVAAALAGRSGVEEIDNRGERRVAAYASVPRVGWTVIAEVPTARAYAAVSSLRRRVLWIALVLAVVLLGGAYAIGRVLRQRHAAEEEMAVTLDQARSFATVNRAVLEAIDEGLVLVGLDGRILSVNRRLRELTEELVPELLRIGAPLADLQNAVAEKVADPDAYRATLSAAAADPEYHGEDTWSTADGGRSYVRTIAPVHDTKGDLLGRMVTLREVSAEREAERLKSELVATVSHELRTPLASILGFAELLGERSYDGETQKRFLRTIRSEASRLTGLVNDFLDLQRIESGRFTVALEPFDLDELVRDQVELFSAQSEQHFVEAELPDEPVRAVGESDRIKQVLANLISNAIKYSPAGGAVKVALETTDGVARLSVTDSGLGIPAAQQAKIFSKFFRVDSSDTREIGGTGLGLALCKELVEAHGGEIGFTSVEGIGSTFWFELPMAARGRHEKKGHVLVVEDDPGAAALLEQYLAQADYAVEVAATGEDALARVAESPPRAICLDITLAGELDGWAVLSVLKADPATSDIPVIICTGGNGRGEASALGAADFLSKPFSADQLRASVARVLPEARGSVLIVDDEESVRSLVVETLGGNGIELREAADGDEALDKIAARPPDAIVLDLVMPTMDGFEVLERLQADAETREIPVIVLTARRLSPVERSSLRSGAVSLLEKNDYSADELRRLVERALG